MKKSKKPISNVQKIKGYFLGWVWPNKLHFGIFVAIILIIAFLIFSAFRDDNQNETSSTTEPPLASQNPENSNDKQQQKTQGNANSTMINTPYTPASFAVTKVFFREYPLTPPGAEEGSCYAGQKVLFTDTAEVTHTGEGTATYHWEIGDPMNETIQKFPDETINFAGGGTSKISKELTFTVHDTSSATGIPGPAFQNRPHINLVFTSPQLIYANIEQPVYAFQHDPNFIWGNYIMLCD